MRPRGEPRELLAEEIRQLPGTARDLATRTQIGFEVARRTLDNMVRAGEATKLDPVRVPGVKRPVPVYGPVAKDTSSAGSAAPADAVVEATTELHEYIVVRWARGA